MRRRVRRKGQKRGRLFWIGAILIALLLLIESQLRPVVEGVAAYQAKVFATRMVNDAVLAELAREGVGYSDFVLLSRNNNGDITSIQSDMVEINRLKAQVTDAVLRELEGMEASSIQIPLGTLMGNELTSGRGPMVELKVYPAGYVQTDIYSRFTDAGINQTHHQIMLGASVQMQAVIPGYSIRCEVTTSYCIAQTVIVGNIPDAYVQLGDGAPLISKIGGEGSS